jgi:hypothetical protein
MVYSLSLSTETSACKKPQILNLDFERPYHLIKPTLLRASNNYLQKEHIFGRPFAARYDQLI